ncbi:unnamed protein product [Linum trigynum]|uniref:Uncharacterized protein n=1 Tax=Linum trigynum TaxID=586398 RepID=A0AAV2F1E6_9ROSI
MSPDLASRGRESRHAKSLHGIRSGIERQIESDSSYFPTKSGIGFWFLHNSGGEGGRNGERRWLGEHRRADEEQSSFSFSSYFQIWQRIEDPLR